MWHGLPRPLRNAILPPPLHAHIPLYLLCPAPIISSVGIASLILSCGACSQLNKEPTDGRLVASFAIQHHRRRLPYIGGSCHTVCINPSARRQSISYSLLWRLGDVSYPSRNLCQRLTTERRPPFRGCQHRAVDELRPFETRKFLESICQLDVRFIVLYTVMKNLVNILLQRS